jgi:hypothetical protein
MMRMLVSLAALMTVAVSAQQPVPINYDTWCAQTQQERIRTFGIVTPEVRADLVRTQITRWLDNNLARLSPEQVSMMRENLTFVTTDIYREEHLTESRARQKQLEQRTAALFSHEDMRQALTIHGDCIPSK